MPKWNLYIGVFSGTLFILLGALMFFLPTPASAPWMKDLLPYVLGGYGLLRLGMSVYLLRRKPPLALFLFVFWVLSCSRGPEENMRIRFSYDGECSTCPLARMDSLLRKHFPKALVETVYDSANSEVILKLDSHYIKTDTLIAVLLTYGYAVNDQLPYNPLLSPCCTSLDLEPAAFNAPSLVSPEEVSPKEEIALLEQELEQELSEDQIPSGDLDEIGNLEESLDELENLDLEGEVPLDIGLEEGLDDLGLDEDLGLGLDESSPSKKKNAPHNAPPK